LTGFSGIKALSYKKNRARQRTEREMWRPPVGRAGALEQTDPARLVFIDETGAAT